MAVWAIGDLHLSFSTPGKQMGVFGTGWQDHDKKIAEFWNDSIQADDLVLLPGDISWAMKLEGAIQDLQWIDKLPGTKVMIRGNHDYWWPSLSKLESVLPKSIHAIHNNAFVWNDYVIGGSRLWDTEEYSFNGFIDFQPNSREKKEKKEEIDPSHIFDRELERLRLSLIDMQKKDPDSKKTRIVMTHYPPIGSDLKTSKASQLLEEFNVNIVVFGHLHSVKKGTLSFGDARGVRYYLTSCDWLDYQPLKILP